MIGRTILPFIEKGIRLKPVVLITGARQVGKTTLCKFISEKFGFDYVTLANKDERRLAINDPDMFLRVHSHPLIIDEAQYAKGLFDSIEALVDREMFETEDSNGMYIITGSQIYQLMENISQSMAGRVTIINVSPLSYSEIVGREEVPFKSNFENLIRRSMKHRTDVMEVYSRIIRGSYPELYQKSEMDTSQYYSDYVDTYISRDVTEIINLKDRNKFLTFMEILASLTGQELVYERLSDAVGISKDTVKSWLGVLEMGGIIHLLPAFYNSAIKRSIKRPKLYFCDTGLACYLAKVFDPESLRVGYLNGPMVETYIVNEILKSYSNNCEKAGFYYYRDTNNNEIDLIVLRDGRLTLIECKAGMTYNASDVKAFSRIKGGQYEIAPSCIICLTEQAYPLKDGVYAIPVTSI